MKQFHPCHLLTYNLNRTSLTPTTTACVGHTVRKKKKEKKNGFIANSVFKKSASYVTAMIYYPIYPIQGTDVINVSKKGAVSNKK